MNAGTYRTDVDAFIAATGWVVSSEAARHQMGRALAYFRQHVPAQELDAPGDRRSDAPIAYRPSSGRWTRLMGWMQAMDFNHRVKDQYVVPVGSRLIAFRESRSMLGNHRFGNFYVLADPNQGASQRPSNRRLGIPSIQSVPTAYEARSTFTCLASTAGDAFLSWVDAKRYGPSYAHGGRQQLFIWGAERFLKPIFD